MKPVHRMTLAATALLAAGAIAPAPAQAACGDSYTIAAGDTLGAIAKRCGVSVAAIEQANPQMGSARSLQIGQELRMPGGQAPAGVPSAERPRADPSDGPYEVRDGDTLFGIAERLGVSVAQLMASNPGLNAELLAPGSRITIPQGDPEPPAEAEPVAGISIVPRYGGPDSQVTVRGSGLAPGEAVTIGVGPPASEWKPLREAEAGPDGALRAEVAVPSSADLGDDLVFVIDRENGETLVSEEFDVVLGRDAGATPPGDDPSRIVVSGTLGEGTECPIVTTADGAVYSLAAGEVAIRPGARVRVEGRAAEMSICMQGQALEVDELREIAPARQ